jgi:hypothetical protein
MLLWKVMEDVMLVKKLALQDHLDQVALTLWVLLWMED